MDIFDHALDLKECLATSVSDLEVHCARVFDRPILSEDQIHAAIKTVWPLVLADARHSSVTPEVSYADNLYQRLAAEVSITQPGRFVDQANAPWEAFYHEGSGDEPRCEDGWVVGQIFWGGYVQALHITLGWLLMSGFRLQNKLRAISPDHESFDCFVDQLRAFGPESNDGEGLRGVFYDYENAQDAGTCK